MTWLVVYKRNGKNVILNVRIDDPKYFVELEPELRMLAFKWLKEEIPLSDIRIY